MGQKKNHEARLWVVLHRLQDEGLTLREEKCELGMTEVDWFGHKFLGVGMRVAEDKAQIIQQWPKPTTVKELKSFLASLQFNSVYMAAEKDIYPAGGSFQIEVHMDQREKCQLQTSKREPLQRQGHGAV